eukprot:CAMPEP_0114536874 /NCGR_PEP_ID=MMETSP0109-20121206/29251_1 /TAXON_ID=29199 /ORGANISM="Chlorarachnion reptans, Strain CCCM449" /LENGTH=305 /DNA_ID=CAMNT_0001720673 /DNA_START=175 /DNA_END=1089 /DNA_ORIENTATION=+
MLSTVTSVRGSENVLTANTVGFLVIFFHPRYFGSGIEPPVGILAPGGMNFIGHDILLPRILPPYLTEDLAAVARVDLHDRGDEGVLLGAVGVVPRGVAPQHLPGVGPPLVLDLDRFVARVRPHLVPVRSPQEDVGELRHRVGLLLLLEQLAHEVPQALQDRLREVAPALGEVDRVPEVLLGDDLVVLVECVLAHPREDRRRLPGQQLEGEPERPPRLQALVVARVRLGDVVQLELRVLERELAEERPAGEHVDVGPVLVDALELVQRVAEGDVAGVEGVLHGGEEGVVLPPDAALHLVQLPGRSG